MSVVETKAVARGIALVGDRGRLILPAAITLGVAVRAFHILRNDFPLNDGGLFYAMTADLQQNGYVPPPFTSFGEGDIPYAYPPLGFYVSGLVADLTPLSLLGAFQLVPLVGTSLTLVAFALLARALLPSRAHVVAATLAFALIPRSFIWLLMGGGITRSLGLAFALFALYYVVRLAREPGSRPFALCVAFSSLTVLTHLETGYFLAFSAVLVWLFLGPTVRSARWVIAVAPAVVLLAAPWWVFVLHHHGLQPLLSAMATGESIVEAEGREHALLSLARLVSTSEPFFPVLGVLAVLGAIRNVVYKQLLLPAWWLAIMFLDPRAAPTFTNVPVALLVSFGVLNVLVPALKPGLEQRFGGPSDRWRRTVVVLAAGCAIFVAAGALNTRTGLGGEGYLLSGLTPGQREAMAWVRANTAPESLFLVVPDGSWQTDREGEWFPVLASRSNIALVQGQEWKPGDAFGRRVRAHSDAWTCGFRTTACLDEWSRTHGPPAFTHVYIPRADYQCCYTLVASLKEDERYTMVYDGAGGTVFHKFSRDRGQSPR